MAEGAGGTNGESSMETCTLPQVKQTASGKILRNRKLSLVLRDSLQGWDGSGGREVPDGGDICTLMAGSCCTAETYITF